MKFAAPTISRLLALASIAAYARPATANPTNAKRKGKGGKSPKGDDCDSDGISNMIIFGDDLSDVGNANNPLFSDDCQQDGVFCGDRQSNGPLVVEYIAEKLCIDVTAIDPTATRDTGNNFAFNYASVICDGGCPNTFESQVLSYLELLGDAQLTFNPVVPPGTLFFNWIGANDVGKAVTFLPDQERALTHITEAITTMKSNIESLIDAGACSFLVLGSLNIAIAPSIVLTLLALGTRSGYSGADLQGFIAGAMGVAEEFSRTFNTQLEAMLEGLTIPDDEGCLGVEFIDLIPLMEGVVASEAYESKFGEFGFGSGVCNFRYHDPITGNLLNNFLPVLAENEIDFECENSPFYDEIHPTTYVSKLVADSLLDAVENFAQGSRRLLRRGL